MNLSSSISNFIKKFIRTQDIYGLSFKYYIKGKEKYHSITGISLSLIINFTSFIFLIFSLIDLYNHRSPTANYVKIRKTTTTNITLNSEDLVYSLAIRDSKYRVINDETIAYINATYEKMTLFNQTVYELNVMNCSKVYNFFKKKHLEERFKSFDVINYKCFYSPEGEIILGGKYSSSFYGNLAIYITKCQNNTKPGVICKPQEEIDNILQGAWLQISYISAYADINNYTNPIQYITKGYYTQIDTKLNKFIYDYFSRMEFTSENSFFFTFSKNYWAIKDDYTLTDINLNRNGVVYTIYICPSFNEEFYYRKYCKIQDICGSVGGIWLGLKFLFHFVIYLYKKKEFCLYLSQCLFQDALNGIDNCKKYQNDILKNSSNNSYKNKEKGLFVEEDKNINENKLYNNKNLHCISNVNFNLNKVDNLINENNLRFNSFSRNNRRNLSENQVKKQRSLSQNDCNSSKNFLINSDSNQNKLNINHFNQIKIHNISSSDPNLILVNHFLKNNPGLLKDSDKNKKKKESIINLRVNSKNGNLMMIPSKKMTKRNWLISSKIIFCPCTESTKKLSDEYNLIYHQLKKYIDFIYVTKLIMHLHKFHKNEQNFIDYSHIIREESKSIEESLVLENNKKKE